MRRLARLFGFSVLVVVAVILNIVLIAMLGKYLGWNAIGSDKRNTQLSGLACVTLITFEYFAWVVIRAVMRKK